MCVTDLEVPTPVTRERVKKFLCELDKSEEGFEYHEHGEHELMFPTESAIIFLGFSNVQRSGPKAYLMPFEDNRRFGLGAETNLVVSKGATAAQLTEFYEVALTMVIGFFQDVADAVPQLVDWEEA
mgnify:CR=1 FL=1